MKNLKSFENFSINENIHLTDDEKKYLWSKIEYTKKKKAIESENDIYQILNDEGNEISNDDFNKILNSLEYNFRKKLSNLDKPINKEIFKSLQNKIPEDWIGVRYSNIKRKDYKD